MEYFRSHWVVHYWRRLVIKYLESPNSSPATVGIKKGHKEYYSLKMHREGPNTESGELNPDSESKSVKNHNKATANRYEKRWKRLIHLQNFIIYIYYSSSLPCSWATFIWPQSFPSHNCHLEQAYLCQLRKLLGLQSPISPSDGSRWINSHKCCHLRRKHPNLSCQFTIVISSE